MKICNNCHRSFDDSVFICPDCGETLASANTEKPTAQSVNVVPEEENKSAKEVLLEHSKKKTSEWDTQDNVILRWLPSILSIIGLIVAWNFSILFGLALAIGGILYGSTTKNALNKKISLSVGIICTILCLICFFI